MTSAMRARQEAASGRIKKQYDTVRIRVRFSDRTQIEHTFPHSATIDDVYTMVDSTLHEGSQGDYMLFQSPPKRDFPRNQIRTTLVQLGFAPAAVLGIRWADPTRNGRLPALTQRRMHLRLSGVTWLRVPATCRSRPPSPPRSPRCVRTRRTARRPMHSRRARSASSPRYARACARLTQWFKGTGGK